VSFFDFLFLPSYLHTQLAIQRNKKKGKRKEERKRENAQDMPPASVQEIRRRGIYFSFSFSSSFIFLLVQFMVMG
jgi:hypothetical protein